MLSFYLFAKMFTTPSSINSSSPLSSRRAEKKMVQNCFFSSAIKASRRYTQNFMLFQPKDMSKTFLIAAPPNNTRATRKSIFPRRSEKKKEKLPSKKTFMGLGGGKLQTGNKLETASFASHQPCLRRLLKAHEEAKKKMEKLPKNVSRDEEEKALVWWWKKKSWWFGVARGCGWGFSLDKKTDFIFKIIPLNKQQLFILQEVHCISRYPIPIRFHLFIALITSFTFPIDFSMKLRVRVHSPRVSKIYFLSSTVCRLPDSSIQPDGGWSWFYCFFPLKLNNTRRRRRKVRKSIPPSYSEKKGIFRLEKSCGINKNGVQEKSLSYIFLYGEWEISICEDSSVNGLSQKWQESDCVSCRSNVWSTKLIFHNFFRHRLEWIKKGFIGFPS